MRTKKEKVFAKFLANSKIFVVDSSSVSRDRLTRILLSLGANSSNILSFGAFNEAFEGIRENDPDIVLTDYKLGKKSGFELLDSYKGDHLEDKKRLFIMVTSNSTQSLVAKAVEEDVDTFILKPYTVDILKETLINAVIDKFFPSPYMKTIDMGKGMLYEGKPDEALKFFEDAKEFSPHPSLACFYSGQAEIMIKSLDDAKSMYKEGLRHNKIHYKCLASLFDVLMEQQKYDEAYDVVKTISKYFPANSERLASVVRLAIINEAYSDVDNYYDNFVDLDIKTPDLLKYVSAAMIVAGRFYLLNGNNNKALDLFDKVGIIAKNESKYLRKIMEYLVEFNLINVSERYFSKFNCQTKDTEDFIVSNYILECSKMKASQAAIKGLDLIRNKVSNYSIHYLLIERLKELSKDEQARIFYDEALTKWPEKRTLFQKIAM